MKYDVIIIGAGPAGYVAAIRAGQTGLKTLVIDKKYIGGMCLNWGCIPTKSIIESAKRYNDVKNAKEFGVIGIDTDKLDFDWSIAVKRTKSVIKRLTKGIEYLWKRNNVEFLQADCKIISNTRVEAGNQIFEASNIIIATGSRPQSLSGVTDVIDLEQLLDIPTLPMKPLLMGRGSSLVELAQFFILIGRNPIIVAAKLPLLTGMDHYLENYAINKLKKSKVPVYVLDDLTVDDGRFYHDGNVLDYDKIINISKRYAVIPEHNVDLDLENGFVKVNEYYQSSIDNIYAIGDVSGKSFLAHSASAQGISVIDHINGSTEILDLHNSPLNIYSYPEIAQTGYTEQELIDQKIDYKVSEYSLSANGKALAEGTSEGVVRILHDNKYNQVLGVQIIADNATDMISEAGVLIELEGTIFDLARTIHAHPTVSEVFMDAAKQHI